uniref:Uncharacterized protein n=1 Tax=Castor canadensis TaxID=51338 RepID=A0A8C0XA80_CASCN
MLALANKLKRDDSLKGSWMSEATQRVSGRDKLLSKEVAKPEANLPCACKVPFPEPNELQFYQLTITPDKGSYWDCSAAWLLLPATVHPLGY